MNDREVAIADALRDVWDRHRTTVIADLEGLVNALTTWDRGARTTELAEEIRTRSHRIRGSLTMVGRDDGADDLRTIETHAAHGDGSYAKEAVERVHGLLVRLRTTD